LNKMGCTAGKTATVSEPQTQQFVTKTLLQDSAAETKAAKLEQPVADTLLKELVVASQPSADGTLFDDQLVDDTMTCNTEKATAVGVASGPKHVVTEASPEDNEVKPCSVAADDLAAQSATAIEESKADGAVPQAPDTEDRIVEVSRDSAFESPAEEPIAEPVTTILEEDLVVPLSSSKEDICPTCGCNYAPCAQNCRKCWQVRQDLIEEVVVVDELKAVDAEVSAVAMDSPTSVSQRAACPSFCTGTS
jgi:hypothetical protein